ncbi:MAG: SRPBCC family protein, partial [Myxococcota bacterium]
MGRKILIALGALVAVLVVVIALQPSTFAVERSIEIAAPPEVVFSHLESPRAMDAWSPWVKMDPEQKITHEGPESGVGAIETWEGPQVGAGRLTITGVEPNEEVEMRLEFTRPMQATNRALYTLAMVGDATRVTWRMEGTNHFIGKAASLVMNMDEMVGGTFERGLADLKALAEADAEQRAEHEAAAQAAGGTAPTMTFG